VFAQLVPNKPERKFNVGDKVRVNLHHGKIEDAIVKAIIQHTDGIKLQVDVVGLWFLAASSNWPSSISPLAKLYFASANCIRKPPLWASSAAREK
jgi:hypothetical protein